MMKEECPTYESIISKQEITEKFREFLKIMRSTDTLHTDHANISSLSGGKIDPEEAKEISQNFQKLLIEHGSSEKEEEEEKEDEEKEDEEDQDYEEEGDQDYEEENEDVVTSSVEKIKATFKDAI